MNLAVSAVLAISAILSTIMLQFGDENGDAGLTIALSTTGVLGAFFFVDYKRTFWGSKALCDAATILVVLANVGGLFRSREEFLAFSIANILTAIESITFYRRKTPRVCYQILTISFIKVAVGCVFQRSPLFALLLPLYGVSAFCAFSLLLLAVERQYYLKSSTLAPRFDLRGLRPKKEEDEDDLDGDLPRDFAKEPDARAKKRAAKLAAKREKREKKAEKKAARKRARSFGDAILATEAFGGFGTAFAPNVRFSSALESPRFSRSSGARVCGVDSEFFWRFGKASFGALAFAAVLFCFFPRIHRLEIGGLEFGRDGWNAGRAAVATTGFSSKIELGELGPAVDNKKPVLTIRFVDLFAPKTRSAVSLDSTVYLRGVALGRYSDRTWSQILDLRDVARSFSSLRRKIREKTAIDPETVLGPETDVDKVKREFRDAWSNERRALRLDELGSSYWTSLSKIKESDAEFGRFPLFYVERMKFSSARSFADLDSVEQIGGLLPSRDVLTSQYAFDSRSQFVGMEIALEPLDAPFLFAVSPFYGAATREPRFEYRDAIPERPDDLAGRKTTYRFLTIAFQNGVQAPLTPNQEIALPFLADYLELNVDRFPRLIETARRWDAESGLPQEDFVGRARYLESRMRDTGEFQYDRNGVERDPALDPLEDFVAERKSGHCEYFAGALALMLRAVGIPSRTVVGFAFLPDKSGKTVVRQSDAHSWTEAFIPAGRLPGPESPGADLFAGNVPNGLPEGTKDWPKDGAWLRLDATPSARLEGQANGIAVVGASWLLFFETIWRDYVLNFNGATQARNVYRPIAERWRETVESFRNFRTEFRPGAAFAEKLKEIAAQFRQGDWSPRAVGNILAVAFEIAVVAYLFFRLARFFRARLRKPVAGARVSRRPDDEKAFALYRRVEMRLIRRNAVERAPNETLREFVERCFELEDAAVKIGEIVKNGSADQTVVAPPFEPTPLEIRRLFRELVERYYRARFGGVAFSADEIVRWNVELQKIGIE